MRFFLQTLLKSVPLFLPLVGIIYASEYRIIAAIAYFPLFFLTEYLVIYRPSKKMEDKRKAILDHYFRPWVEKAKVKGQKPQIRINIMLVRMWFNGKHFFQFYGYEMVGYPDGDLHLHVKRGFSGWCLRQRFRQAYFRDLRELTVEDIRKQFHFDNRLHELTKHIKGIVCVPLVRTRKVWLVHGLRQDFFGVLNVDAVDDLGVRFLEEEATLQTIYSFARFSEIVFG